MNALLKSMLVTALIFLCLLTAQNASADHIKNMASIQGVRDNQLLGYGIESRIIESDKDANNRGSSVVGK